ncbi:MAG: WYL domain-containing protein [Akkermansiaceae bacterium]
MGNITNEENWAAQERLRAIERAVWWRGWIKRKDIVAIFGVSLAQSSSDLQKYQELNPKAMVYDLSHKRYEAAPAMQCLLHQPLLEDAIRCFLPSPSIGFLPTSVQIQHEKLASMGLPTRKGKDEVERMIMQALLNTQKLKIQYWSVSSGKNSWREIAPSGLGHDGYRWHTRAYCYENADYRDFVLSRISSTHLPTDQTKENNSPHPFPLPTDQAWETLETIKLKPNSKLPENAKRAIEMDYGIRKDGILKLEVRQAMREYLLAHMRVSDLKLQNHFELEE